MLATFDVDYVLKSAEQAAAAAADGRAADLAAAAPPPTAVAAALAECRANARTLRDYGRRAMEATDPDIKALLTLAAEADWPPSRLAQTADTGASVGSTSRDAAWRAAVLGPAVDIDEPGSHPGVELRPPHLMPRRGKGGSPASRARLLHSLVHVEAAAMNLAWDLVLRFDSPLGLHKSLCPSPPPAGPARGQAAVQDTQREGQAAQAGDEDEGARPDQDAAPLLPPEFYADWLRVAAEEARHHLALKARLGEYGVSYGDEPGHDGLWQDCLATRRDLLGRLVLEHCIHEARGLDVTGLKSIPLFQRNGDDKSAALLQEILDDEVTHCRDGLKWFRYIFRHHGVSDAATVTAFHDVARRHFKGLLKGPFNTDARAAAGMGPEWYMPLSSDAPHASSPASMAAPAADGGSA